jgi:hypothetical protein
VGDRFSSKNYFMMVWIYVLLLLFDGLIFYSCDFSFVGGKID